MRQPRLNKPRNPTGKGGFKKGQSGNPGGFPLERDRIPRTSTELDLKELAKRFTRPALATVIAIMRNRDNPPSVRLAAADLVMKRGHGNPVQPHANPDGSALNFTEMTDEQILANLSRLNALLARSDNEMKDIVH